MSSQLSTHPGNPAGANRFFDSAQNFSIQNANILSDSITNNYYSDTVSHASSSEQVAAIANWLSPTNYWKYHHDLSSKRTAGTGKWLVAAEKFVKWSSDDAGVLWITGIPGSGKSMLASLCVDTLQSSRTEGGLCSSAVAFVYCRYTDQCTAKSILCAFLRQLLEEHHNVCLPVLQPFYNRFKARQAEPMGMDIKEALLAVISLFNRRVEAVIDGLDEVPDDEAAELLDVLSSLPMKLVILSRPLELLMELIPNTVRIIVDAKTEDIELFVGDQLRKTPALRRLLRGNNTLQGDVTRRIIEKSGGMFLVAALQLEAIKGSVSMKSLNAALDSLPSGVDAMYLRTMERIESQAEEQTSLAKRTLLWLTHARRALTVEELQHALATSHEVDGGTFDPEALTPPEIILSVCCGLVVTSVYDQEDGEEETLDELQREVRLIHYTAQEYLTPLETTPFSHAHTITALTCMVYLRSQGYHYFASSNSHVSMALPEQALTAQQYFLMRLPFGLYAQVQLGPHARILAESSSTESRDALAHISHFLSECPRLQLYIFYPPRMLIGSFWGLVDAFSFAAYHSIFPLLPDLKHLHKPSLFSGHCTALHLAVMSENANVVEILLRDYPETIGDVNAQASGPAWRDRSNLSNASIHDDENYTALVLALELTLWKADSNSEALFRLVCSHKTVDPNASRPNEPNPLSRAAFKGHVSICRTLLSHPKIDVNRSGSDTTMSSTPLGYAMHSEDEITREEVIQLLLDHPDIDPNLTIGDNKEHLLTLAADSAEVPRMRLLLAHPRIDVNIQDTRGFTPLMVACENFHRDVRRAEVVRTLISHPDIEVNRQNEDGSTALMIACLCGFGEAVRALLARDDVVLKLRNVRGETALVIAARRIEGAYLKG